jgi:uncharacterized Tic20 family protein
MPDCMPSASLPLILSYLLPPAGALLSAIALWVASKARSTSADAQSTSQAAVALSLLQAEPPEPNGYPPDAPDRRKS